MVLKILIFFQRVTKHGFKIYWCAEAEVYETVPASRVTLLWIAKRSFRNGSGDAISRIRITPSLKTYLRVTVLGTGRLIFGFLLFAKGMLFLDYTRLFKGMRIFIAGIGTYAGILGINYNEYKVIHGS